MRSYAPPSPGQIVKIKWHDMPYDLRRRTPRGQGSIMGVIIERDWGSVEHNINKDPRRDWYKVLLISTGDLRWYSANSFL